LRFREEIAGMFYGNVWKKVIIDAKIKGS